MKIFVLNCGSTTFKYQLIDMKTREVLAKGLVEKIGLPDVTLTYVGKNDEKITEILGNVGHKEGIERTLALMQSREHGVIPDLKEINAVGHRVVHGGDKFKSSVIINNDALKAIEDCVPLAPLHNPANILGIQVMQKAIPGVPNVAVFDTAYHQTMPEESFRYAIPEKYYTQHKIRKYGFHGTSHQFVSAETAKLLAIPYENFNAISCHIGGGASITAIKNGKSYDTSMGFTPLQGLIMASRSGDIDPAVSTFLQSQLKMSYTDVDNLYNKESGLLGLSGISSDLRDIEAAVAKGDKNAKLAIDAFIHRIVMYIGGYAALLGKVDAIIFTAGVGENGKEIRAEVAKKLAILGVKIDDGLNNVRGEARVISHADSKIKLVLMPTNEELMIAIDTQNLI